jgi:hypothetical protein
MRVLQTDSQMRSLKSFGKTGRPKNWGLKPTHFTFCTGCLFLFVPTGAVPRLADLQYVGAAGQFRHLNSLPEWRYIRK